MNQEDLTHTFSDQNKFPGIYRGVVIWNDDPTVHGRIKVFVPGVYSDKYYTQPANLPWARPLSPSFGGGAPNPNNNDKHVLNDEVGWCSVPHHGTMETGSQVFVFFENENINFPVYFGVAQSQEGWFSEHPNQHCFRSDNVRVRIDENVKDSRSTCKFNSYNTYNSEVSKKNLERDCARYGWIFNKDEGNIEQLETRIDIEIEATKMNAVNLNIHGNVNMHIDGDWFVEHFGNKYEYHEGDTYIKHKGQTYIEEEGHRRKVHKGNYSLEHNGNTVENQEGDTLITRTGTYWDQIDNDVTHMYNGNYKIKINGNDDEIVRNDKIVDIGNGLHMNVIDNANMVIGGHLAVNVDTHIDLDIKDNFEIHSKTGNIVLKTDGDFELMKNGAITAEGFKNLGTRGNIQLISTFGNVNIQCIKNDAIANFNTRMTVIPWNPDFVREIKENAGSFPDFSALNAALKGMNFSTDISTLGDFTQLMKDAQDLLIYDGLPVFLPSKMIIQNPNVTSPKNADDLSWIPLFRGEVTDWRNIQDDVMWKLPGRTIGNINIETWSGDINIKTESELGCAGNVNITAIENIGTFNGYRIGTINFKSQGKERIYPDPRDLFLDSDFYQKNAGKLNIFKHSTNPSKAGRVLPDACKSLEKSSGYEFKFYGTNYDNFYNTYAMNVATQGFTLPVTKVITQKCNDLKKQDPPRLGCPKCVGDYLLGIPGMPEKYFENENLVEIRGGYHVYGFQRLNPKDPCNTRGVFNIAAGEYDKISIGDGHAIANLFMERDFGTTKIGGVTFNGNGDMKVDIGKNYFRTINNLREKAKTTECYKVVETPLDFSIPSNLQEVLNVMKQKYEASPAQYIQQGKQITLEPTRGPKTYEAAGGFKSLDYMYSPKFEEGGFIYEHIKSTGEEQLVSEIEDKRIFVDYGFDFERAKDLINSKDVSKIESNVKEGGEFTYIINRGADYEMHSGGNSRWFQVRCYDPGGATHVEISANFNDHKFKLNDRSGHWVKSHEYHDQGFVWWDDEKFDSDLVHHFPDSEYDIESKEVDRIWSEIATEKKHHSWSKYGNHIKASKHIEYNPPTNRCGSMHLVVPGGEDLVDSVPLLWQHKKGAGVKVSRNRIVTANQINKHHFSLNSANCGKNQNIETSEIWNALTHIYQTTTKTAGKNLFDEQYYTSDVNRHAITYKAAVNTDILTLNSDHVVFTPNEEPSGYYMLDSKFKKPVVDFVLRAGNVMKREMIGNQQYFNYEPPILNQSWQHSNYSNNFEVSQNGFPQNSYKVLNGTNTMWPSEGSTPESAKYVTNEMIMSNGGNGDTEAVAAFNVTYYNPAITGGVSGTPTLPLSSNNIFYFTNGINNKTSPALNSIRVNNGNYTDTAYNTVALENGSTNISGANIIRVDNNGGVEPISLTNSITLNNDRGLANIILSDHYDKEDPTHEPKDAIISEYALHRLSKQSEGDIIAQSPSGIFIYDEKYVNASKYAIKNTNLTIDSDSVKARFKVVDANANELALKTNSMKVDSKDYVLTTRSMKNNGSNVEIQGESMSILGREITMNKVIATGTFTGHLDGSMNGVPMVAGLIALPSPVPGVAMTLPDGPSTSFTLSEPEAPVAGMLVPTPQENKQSNVSEKKSLSIISKTKAFIKKFIDIELSLLDAMNGR